MSRESPHSICSRLHALSLPCLTSSHGHASRIPALLPLPCLENPPTPSAPASMLSHFHASLAPTAMPRESPHSSRFHASRIPPLHLLPLPCSLTSMPH